MKDKGSFTNVSEYIALQPAAVREGLELLRATIRKAAPKAEETISYNMPAYRQHAVLVYFAANKTHYGFYPTGAPMEAFREKLSGYKTSKGAIQFPIGEPIPVKLVTEIVKWRIKDDLAREIVKNERKKVVKKSKAK
jgi:uncharacterized protein YdhG (YjbR/CyaY superfamily)